MIEKNPFQKRTVAYLFFEIDKFFNSKKASTAKGIFTNVSSTLSIFIDILEIFFIIIKTIIEVVYLLTIGLLIGMFISNL